MKKFKLLQEVNVLTSLRLSETQKELLCKILAAQTDELAYEVSETGVNIVAARDQLTDLGLMEWSVGSASVTDTGIKVLQDEALVDQDGQLTEIGNKYAYGEGGSTEQQQQEPPQTDDPFDIDMNDMGGEQRSPTPQTQQVDPTSSGELAMDMASFSLMKRVNDTVLAEIEINDLLS